MWENHQGLRGVIMQGWDKGAPCVIVDELGVKLKNMSKGLGKWSTKTFGNARKEIKRLKLLLEELRGDPLRTEPSHVELKINEQLIQMYHREEIMWRQRARLEWLVAGDKNTKNFHLRASIRRNKNMIKALQNSLGVEITDPEELKVMVTTFYEGLYASEGV